MNIHEYYNKFNEDKRLDTRRGQVEFKTSMKYIKSFIKKGDKVLDVGAGTGKYSIELFNEGYSVTAVELVKHNLEVIKKKNKDIPVFEGNALDLSRFNDNEFDIVLLFGPMYHLKSNDELVKSLSEAKRVVKNDGYIFVSYCMNEYAVIEYGFLNDNIKGNLNSNEIDKNFHITEKGNPLYHYVRLEDINDLNRQVNLKRIKIISSDGPSSYLRKTLNKMDDESFSIFLNYHFATCERQDLIGASTHTLDILKK